MADLVPPGVVLLEAGAERRLERPAPQDGAFGFRLDVHHLLLLGGDVVRPPGLGRGLLVDAHVLHVRGLEVGEHVLRGLSEEVAAVDEHALDLLAVGIDLFVADLDAGQLPDEFAEAVVGQRLEGAGVVDRRIAPEDHRHPLADHHHLCDRLRVHLHPDGNRVAEFVGGVAFAEVPVADVGDLQIDRVAEDAVACVGGDHLAVVVPLGGGSLQRVAPACDADRGADERIARLAVLDHHQGPVAAGTEILGPAAVRGAGTGRSGQHDKQREQQRDEAVQRRDGLREDSDFFVYLSIRLS